MTTPPESGFALRVPHAEPVVADRPPVMGAAPLGLERLGAAGSALAALLAAYGPR
ncbi:hypothetical protein WBK31_18455 [Nonomuraea sp. N2-4H]|uniref:hypothetical protein n=1 Tax=Nonomuraea sp. N2-4H TaxID=3128898 RepID=UPI003244151B